MKIIDLLDDRSILLDGRVADKKAALDQRRIVRVCMQENRKEALVLVRELLFHIANRMRLSNRDLQLWL